MADEPTAPGELVTPEGPTSPAKPPPRRRPLRIAFALLTFLIGIVVGGAAVLLIIFANGKISNIQVTFAEGSEMTITGQYQYTVLNIPVTQQFTIVLQPGVDACKLQLHIIKANYGGIPVTGFATIFENTINQKLHDAIPSTIANGTYAICMVGVHTQPNSITINFTATPRSA
ncbi:MAG: hypothetical protein AUG82_03890 [Ktedonobacter sp. 13_1_20CM_4_53_11]|nr:MAG: hypothetical protein AUG82_03890 [Ktedonobacter sp. 13_1_20CM_4_53_11]